MPQDLSVLRAHPIALVGLMGVGKTTVGRRLAKHLDLPFYDSDDEIEKASGRTVVGYFRDHGETAFREGERRVISRLMNGEPKVLATGGGAFIPDATRECLLAGATVVWLKGDFETIMSRVTRKDTRPLLQVPDPRARMRELMDERYPIYAKAHITVDIATGPHMRTVNKVIRTLHHYFSQNSDPHAAQNSATFADNMAGGNNGHQDQFVSQSDPHSAAQGADRHTRHINTGKD